MTEPATKPVDDQIRHVAERIAQEFQGRVPDQVVRTLVDEVYGTFREARVTQFVPVLVDRTVRRQLRTSA